MLTARIAVLASGGGTNLQALIDSQDRGELHSGSIRLVVADKPGIRAIERAEKAGIPAVVIPRREERFEERVAALVKSVPISLTARDSAGELLGVCFGITDFA